MTAYQDCMIQRDCECAKRGYPRETHDKCLVPSIIAEAARLGWHNPYPRAAVVDEVMTAMLAKIAELRGLRDLWQQRGDPALANALEDRARSFEEAVKILRQEM